MAFQKICYAIGCTACGWHPKRNGQMRNMRNEPFESSINSYPSGRSLSKKTIMKRNSRGYTVNIADNRIITDEDRVHQQVVKWLNLVHPGIMYHSDAAGELMTESI